MPLVVPVKFTYASRDLWFDPQDLDILEADYAICSTCLLYTSDAADEL